MAETAKLPSEQPLSVQYVLDQLRLNNILTSQQIAQLRDIVNSTSKEERPHPLVVVSDFGLHSNTKPSYPLTLEQLTRWLAMICSYIMKQLPHRACAICVSAEPRKWRMA